MKGTELRQAFIDFYRAHDHAPIGSAPLIPQDDPSVLFTTAGMHPLVPFLLGEKHPAGTRLTNYQKCLRTNDIAEVGDGTHLTFFEMLGAWSLGDYWKGEALHLSYRFLTERLGFDPNRLYVTCFAGNEDAPRDEEAAAYWREIGIPNERILFLPKSENWWGPAGNNGPCGPDSEMFYDTQPDGPAGETPATNGQRFWEIGNNVFLQYDQLPDKTYRPLLQRDVDLGMGFERLLAVMQGVGSSYETDLFVPIIDKIRSLASKPGTFAERIIADHIRAATMIMAEGIGPGNLDQPYIARRLIRRAARYGREIGISGHFLADLSRSVIETLGDAYPELKRQEGHIIHSLDEEETRFVRTLADGEKEFATTAAASRERGETELPGGEAFRLYSTYGFPAELTQELAQGMGLGVDMVGFERAFAEHQEESRRGGAGRFRGGLAERNPATTRLHTATHLLQQALRQVLGTHVEQRGSNITTDRLRFDFVHGERMTPAQIAAVEAIVNSQIAGDLPVSWREMSVDEARQAGAIGLFGDRYDERVKVYSIGDFSREICGGPHVEHSGELGHFRIVKEEAVSSGIRRIRAVLEPQTEINNNSTEAVAAV